MRAFLADLWADLRDKRLWPVAVVLAAGLVAVPLVLKKSAEEPPPAEPVAAAQQRSAPEPEEIEGLASVKLEETESAGGSSLDTFDPSDPFRPPLKVVEESEEEAGDGLSEPGDVTLSEEIVEGGSGAVDTGSGGATGESGVDTADPGRDMGGGDDDGTRTETTQYAFVIDVTFTNNGRTRKVKGMERLDMLPSAASPLLLFLGVSTNAGNAVFLVDSTLVPAGEGRCEPSEAECAFLHLGAGSEHMFTTEDGDSYRLRVDQIRKVRVDGDASASASRRGGRASAALASPAKRRRRLGSPLISDLVSVSSTSTPNSTGGGDRR
jgi:hypothetical protein